MSVQKLSDNFSLPAILETLRLPDGCEGRVWKHLGASLLSRPHRHAELEANLATRGTASYLVGDARLDLKPGTLLWLFPKDDHILLNRSPDFEMWIAVWTPALTTYWCRNDAAFLARSDAPTRAHSRLAEADKTFLETLLQDLTDASGDSVRCNAGLAYLLLSLCNAHKRAESCGEAASTIHSAVEKTVRLLRSETDPLNIEEISHRVGISASRLSHLFRAQTGHTVAEFRNRQRIARFLSLCEDHKSRPASPMPSLLTIALEAGFGSYAQFFRVFRAVIGCSPNDYFK